MKHALFLLFLLLPALCIKSGDQPKSDHIISVLDQKVADVWSHIAQSKGLPALSVRIFLRNIEVTNLPNTFRELGATSLKDVDVQVHYSLDEKDGNAIYTPNGREGGLFFE